MVTTRSRNLASVQEVQEAKPSRMTLANIISGKIDSPDRIFVLGVEGVGKTTFGADAPEPIFISTESGTGRVKTSRFPEPETYDDVLAAVETLLLTEHTYKTLVIDTIDWLWPLITADVVRRNGVTNIEEVGGGYGKGYEAARSEMKSFLSKLEQLRMKRSMRVILLAHVLVKPFKNPKGPDYDRYQAAFDEKAYGIVKQWVDQVVFATFEETISEQKGRAKGVSTGRRVMYSEHSAAFDAKNRLELPQLLPFSWADFAEARAGESDERPVAADLIADCVELATNLGLPEDHKARVAITAAGDNVEQLIRILNKLRTMAAAA